MHRVGANETAAALKKSVINKIEKKSAKLKNIYVLIYNCYLIFVFFFWHHIY